KKFERPGRPLTLRFIVVQLRNRRGKALKILVYDGQGFWLCQKRLSSGRFRFWPTTPRGEIKTRRLESHELQVLLACGNPLAAKGARPWRRVDAEVRQDPFG
ncbi:MAG: IS66 family insertion sequence element accessory protein TnpB, partial [Candidatus Marinimicrobia bacterium]|nr:IS66 family insertion sequence element accessory protein TnpB [Candidatus Neomarinimicrobiota bacterium]